MSRNIKDKQNELKDWITKIGMTQKYFIGQYSIDNFYNCTDDEIDQYYEKFKKELSRKSTKIEVLEKYFSYLYDLEEFKKIGYIKPTFISSDCFSEDFDEKMKNISKMITEELVNKS